MELFGRKKILHCANCGKVMKHKYKPPDDSGIEGLLCADCHIDKTKEQVLKKQEEKKRHQGSFAEVKTGLVLQALPY